MMKKIIFKTFLILLAIFPSAAWAQEMYLVAPTEVKAGESLEINIELHTGGVLINSASLVLDYNENIFSFAGYKSEDSIIGLWVDPPKAAEGKVSLSGIIPGGVSGEFDPQKGGLQDITLATLIFKAEAEGRGEFAFLESQVLKHDGKGREFAHTAKGTTVLIAGVAEGEVAPDVQVPNSFELTFLDAGFFSRTPSMVIWNTDDAESGIKEYKVKTGWGTWKTGESPYAVSRGFLPKQVSVRAYDYSGNFNEASITIPGLISWQIFAGIIAVILLCIGGFKMIK